MELKKDDSCTHLKKDEYTELEKKYIALKYELNVLRRQYTDEIEILKRRFEKHMNLFDAHKEPIKVSEK